MNNYEPSFKEEISNPEGKSDWKGLIATVIIGLIIGLIVGYFVFGKGIFDPFGQLENSGSEVSTGTSTTNTKTNNNGVVSTPGNGLYIQAEDQAPNLRVQIKSLKLTEGAWLVTFAASEDRSRPDRIIGAQFFVAGTYTDVTSYLGEGLLAGEKYFVALYRDDSPSEPHVFDSKTDQPILQSGFWVMDSFEVLQSGSRG